MCPRSEGFDAAGKKLVAEKSVQELGERARCKHDVGRQTAIECMRHLIEVVADPPQFSEEGRVDLVQRCLRDFDLAVRTQDAQLAERRQLHVGALSGEQQSGMIGIRHTDVDLSVASLFQLARHRLRVSPQSRSWVRGTACALTGRGAGEERSGSPCRVGFASKSTSRYPSASGYVLRSFWLHIRCSYSQLIVVRCSIGNTLTFQNIASTEVTFCNVAEHAIKNFIFSG